jgi:hypothetical protein
MVNGNDEIIDMVTARDRSHGLFRFFSQNLPSFVFMDMVDDVFLVYRNIKCAMCNNFKSMFSITDL